MKTVFRGEIWYADLHDALGSEQQNRRPVLILQTDSLNAASPTTIIAPITSQIKLSSMPSHCVLSRTCPLREHSMILTEQVRTIDRQHLDYFVGRLDKNDLRSTEQALCFSLGLSE